MGKFLVRDDKSGTGYAEVDNLPNRGDDPYLPWAVTGARRVVFAPIAASNSVHVGGDRPKATPLMIDAKEAPKGTRVLLPENAQSQLRQVERMPAGLRAYDTAVSQERRTMCHTALGLLALTKPRYSRDAVRSVSLGVRVFLTLKLAGDYHKTQEMFYNGVGKYLYGTTNYLSFGRLSDKDLPKADGNKDLLEANQDRVWWEARQILKDGDPLESALNIHDAVGRTCLKQTDGGKFVTYKEWLDKLRAEGDGEMINEGWRGRHDKEKDLVVNSETKWAKIKVEGSKLPGSLSASLHSEAKHGFIQSRKRGVDKYFRISPKPAPEKVDPLKSANRYYQDLDHYNELFGAGPSGTTGTLLAAAFTFGYFSVGDEEFKQYMFAIIGYLVGGGMHSLNESLAVLRLLKLEYNIGTMLSYKPVASFKPVNAATVTFKGKDGNPKTQTFEGHDYRHAKVSDKFPLLPASFTNSKDCDDWRDEYYDIVILGGTHWRQRAAGA